jgi:hypothetical protein
MVSAKEDSMDNLATLLQRERLLLELLVFKITELRHLLVDGDARFLGWAAEEVERAVEAVRLCELERVLLVEDAAHDLPAGDYDESTLLDRLAASADEPWRTLLTEHRAALTALALEVQDGLAAARRLSEAGSDAVSALFERVGDEIPGAGPALLTYGPGSTTTWSAPAPRVRTTL